MTLRIPEIVVEETTGPALYEVTARMPRSVHGPERTAAFTTLTKGAYVMEKAVREKAIRQVITDLIDDWWDIQRAAGIGNIPPIPAANPKDQ